ncbi:MAG: hypothetical protein JST55_14035 [Bacteroidetes bacterium]|nr:hypothetical protein [Bacteroidota bacterium]
MKKKQILSLFLSLIALIVFNVNAKAQTDGNISPRLYVITQSSANCLICTDNQTRWNTEVRNYYSNDPSVIFLNYDLTDDKTMATTRADLDKYGIYNSISSYNTPGSVILVDPVTKQVVGTTTISSSTQDILKSINGGNPSPSK